jgi:hypothetical protein
MAVMARLKCEHDEYVLPSTGRGPQKMTFGLLAQQVLFRPWHRVGRLGTGRPRPALGLEGAHQWQDVCR